MNISIITLSITAFKGIRHLKMQLDGKSADISGRNGTGKTSVYDAYLWLLFGKDSEGKTKFDVKPLDENGNVRTGADTEVEAVLDVDGRRVTLRRVLHEKWKATKDSADPVYSGDETQCYIDDVPVKLEKDYQPYIAGLIGDEDRFKLLSIHGAFMGLPWEKRRRYLVDAAGGSAEAEILARPGFGQIPEILQGQSPENAKKRLADQRKRVKDELDTIPARLDELQKMYDPPTAEALQDAKDRIDACKMEMQEVNKKIDGTADVFAEAAALGAKIRRVNSDIDLRKAELDRPIREAAQAFRERMDNAKARRASLGREADRLEGEIADIDADISRYQKRRETLLAEWHRIDDEPYVPKAVETVCSLCGQPLPSDQIAHAREGAERTFYAYKQDRLCRIEQDGKTTAERIVSLQSERKGIQESLEKKRLFIASVEEDIKVLEAEDALPKPQHYAYEQDEKYTQLMEELQQLREEAERPKDTRERDALLTLRDQLTDAIADLQLIFVQRDNAYKIRDRINALEDRRQELGAQVIDLNGQITLLAEFTTACCTVMESRINSMFHKIQWKLYDHLKDGSIKDCCDATLNGVDYATNLNNGARINAGIEIIRVLSRSVGVTVPCFVDNAEAVNDLAYAAGQMIRLRVSNDNELTMVLEG